MSEIASSRRRNSTSKSQDAELDSSRENLPIFDWLMGCRPYALGGAALFGLAGIAVIAAETIAIPTQYTFSQPIGFVFSPNTTGFYPDGSPFGITDVTSNDVLKQVYDSLKLNDMGIEFSRFVSGVSIRPFSPVYEDVLDSFRNQLSDRRLTAPEREAIETDLRDTLSSMTAKSAIVSLTVPASYGISPGLGETIVAKIPETWSHLAVTEKGVLDLPRRSSTKPIVSDSVLQLDPVIASETLQNAASRIGDKFTSLSSTAQILNVRDPQSGKTLSDLRLDFSQINLSLLAPASVLADTYAAKNSPEHSIAFLTRVSEELKRGSDVAKQNSANLSQSINRITTTSIGGATEGSGKQADSSDTGQIVPQLNSDFLSSLMTLVRQSSPTEFAFRKQLIETQINADRTAASLIGESARVDRRLAELTDLKSQTDLKEIPTREEVRQSIKAAMDAINSVWKDLNTLAEGVSVNRISYADALYTPLLNSTPFTTYSPALNVMNAIVVAMMVLFGFIVGGVIGFGRKAQQFYKRTRGSRQTS